MRYCTRCLYPQNHPYGIVFDKDGVCSGCRVHEEKDKLDLGKIYIEHQSETDNFIENIKSLKINLGHISNILISVTNSLSYKDKRELINNCDYYFLVARAGYLKEDDILMESFPGDKERKKCLGFILID